MKKALKKTSKFAQIIKNHIKENVKAYIIVSTIMLIGIILGVIFVNSLSENQIKDIQNYLESFITSLKENKNINSANLLNKSLKNNSILVLIMWFMGSTVVGIPIVIGVVTFRGFCFGYTTSIVVNILGAGKGTLFLVTSVILQNLIFIPCVIALAVSGIKLYKSIIKDKRRENVKIEIIRHTIFSFILLLLLIISSVIETYLSTNLLLMCISYF